MNVGIVEKVGIKSKKTKLGKYTPSDPIRTTKELESSKISDNFSLGCRLLSNYCNYCVLGLRFWLLPFFKKSNHEIWRE